MKIEDAFRKLRLAWFNYHLKSYAHEREWEDEENEKIREEQNSKRLEFYNSQTEKIINGEDLNLFPTSSYDLYK